MKKLNLLIIIIKKVIDYIVHDYIKNIFLHLFSFKMPIIL